MNYANMTVRQLRAICREFELTGYAQYVKQGKAALITWMESHLTCEMPVVPVPKPDIADLPNLSPRGASTRIAIAHLMELVVLLAVWWCIASQLWARHLRAEVVWWWRNMPALDDVLLVYWNRARWREEHPRCGLDEIVYECL